MGRSLSLVKDHMHVGDRIPRGKPDDDFHKVLENITSRNFGIVAICNDSGDLIGAISDGDLRRHLLEKGSDGLSAKAKDLMTENPKTIIESELAIDALRLMNDGFGRPITQLFVTKDEKSHVPVGIVRLHDLLSAKIV